MDPHDTMSAAAITDNELERRTTAFVSNHMRQYDSSHDIHHVARVLRLARYITSQSPSFSEHSPLNPTLVMLAAVLHDVNDHKYSSSTNAPVPLSSFLASAGVPSDLAATVKEVVETVSYSYECRCPEKVKEVLARHPELGVVQDADRLDALGAVGIGRCFTYGASQAAKNRREQETWINERGANSAGEVAEKDGAASCKDESKVDGWYPSSMEDAILHFGEKLERLEGMMKTKTGKRLARARTKKLRMFREWWEDESDGMFERELSDDGIVR